jgi:hypothetical protein
VVLRREVAEPEVVAEVRGQAAAPAKIVSARPDTIWFARSVTTRNAWISAIAAPANAATAIASTSTSEPAPRRLWTAQNPVTAPTSIIPSTPRLSTPERSARSSPSAAKRRGVP